MDVAPFLLLGRVYGTIYLLTLIFIQYNDKGVIVNDNDDDYDDYLFTVFGDI